MRFLYAIFLALIANIPICAEVKDPPLFFLQNNGSKLQKSDLAFVISQPFVVDLIGGDGKFVKIGVILEVNNLKTKEAIKIKLPLIEECIARILFSKTFEEISTQEGINNLKKEIAKKVNLYVDRGRVTSVIFSEFIIQTKTTSLHSSKKSSVFAIPEPFVLNLMGQNGRRYLKASISLKMSDLKMQKEATSKLALIKDRISQILSSKTFEEISTPKGKDRLKEEILQELNSYMVEGHFKSVLFTEFIIQ